MTNRVTLECDSCGTRIITRTQIGWGDSQIHSFPCPVCGIGITYKVILDQKKITVKYDPKPENAHWVDSEIGANHVVNFNAELLIPEYAITHPFLSSFISVCHHFKNWPHFQRQELARLNWRKNIWPITKRLPIHFEKGNWKLFDSDAAKIGESTKENSIISRLELLRHIYDVPISWMLYPDFSRRSRISQRIALASSISVTLMNQISSDFNASGRLKEIWRQLQHFHDSFVNCFPYLSPLLQPKIYWGGKGNLVDYVVCDKRFGPLKNFYIECFETFCRLSVIASSIEAIIFYQKLEIPTKKGSLDLWSFEKLPNANKGKHLIKFPIADLFVSFMDTSLRNGIGHNSAKYDSSNDEVVCIQQSGSALIEERIHYTIFCDKVLELASVLFHSEEYFFTLLTNAGGIL
ncbi:MAG: hypothetical protein ACLPYB_10440 [Desulfobaccales bacterium]